MEAIKQIVEVKIHTFTVVLPDDFTAKMSRGYYFVFSSRREYSIMAKRRIRTSIQLIIAKC